ncbi:MAG: hypothetical protein VX206_06360 [Pseudomonadota bacterium]|nr:hypothetical protein [Pseudomonadota bacterium]
MPISRILRLLLRPLIVLAASTPIIMLLLSIETGPIVNSADSLTAEEITRIEQLLIESAPSSPGTPGRQSIDLNVDELNLFLDYGLNLLDLSRAWATQLSLEEGLLQSEVSIEILSDWIPLYLNINSEFVQVENRLQLEKVTVGKLQIPDRLIGIGLAGLRNNLTRATPVFEDINQLIANVEKIDISSSQMQVQIYWDPELIGKISDEAQQLFITDDDRIRIIEYYESINAIATTIPTDIRAISLNALLVPLFMEAQERSDNGNDPIDENRSLLQALAIYVSNEDLSQLVGETMAAEVPRAKFIEVRLQRRQDLAQHVTSIAAISALAGAELAKFLSTTKEAYDARYRSGFSFSDLTANTVGVTLANYLTANSASAIEMQRRLSKILTESDYMPEVGNNRDGISETDFNAIYIDRNSTEYNQRLEEIQSLIDARPLFQGLQ